MNPDFHAFSGQSRCGRKGAGLTGAVPVEVVRTEWIGTDALNVVYRGADGPAEVLLFRDAEPVPLGIRV